MTGFSFRLVTSSNAEARTKMSDVVKASSQRDLDALHTYRGVFAETKSSALRSPRAEAAASLSSVYASTERLKASFAAFAAILSAFLY